VSRTPTNFKQLGVTGLRRYGPYVYEEFLPELRWPAAGRVYQEMADNDAVIGSIMYLAEMLIRGCTWEVKACGSSDVDKEAAKFLRECMGDMDMSWDNTICEILSMMVYGFSFHEIVYKVRRGPEETNSKYRSKYSDGRIGWRRLPCRAQTSLAEWEFDEEGDVRAFIQRCEPDFKTVRIPMTKGLLFRTRISKDNPEGKSLLRNAYRSWFFKKHFEEIEGIGIERDLAGFPVLTAPENLDLWNEEDPKMVKMRADAEALVASVRRDSEEGMLLPHGWELKLLTSGSSRQIDIGSTIDRYDNRIAITMLSDIILIGNNRTGSFALADTKQSLLAAALQAQVSNIADVFNAFAVPKLFAMNSFPGLVDFPKIVPSGIQTPSVQEVALMLRAMGLNISKDKELLSYLWHILGFPSMSEETFKEVYMPQGDHADNSTGDGVDTDDGVNIDDPDDPAQKLMEQNDQRYV
jgi:hypothetical protein